MKLSFKDSLSAAVAEKMNAICDRFESAWKSGTRPCRNHRSAPGAADAARRGPASFMIGDRGVAAGADAKVDQDRRGDEDRGVGASWKILLNACSTETAARWHVW